MKAKQPNAEKRIQSLELYMLRIARMTERTAPAIHNLAMDALMGPDDETQAEEIQAAAQRKKPGPKTGVKPGPKPGQKKKPGPKPKKNGAYTHDADEANMHA